MSFINIPDAISPFQTWQDPVLTFADLPLVGNTIGDARITQDTAFVYVWNGTSWVPRGTTGSGTVVGPSSSVFGEIAIYEDTSGQNIGRSSGTGVAHLTSGVLSVSNVVLTSEVSGILPIANGGTNSSTALNNKRIMVSLGGSIVEAAALTNGQLLIGSTGNSPVAANISGTANQVSVANGAGTITLSTPQDIAPASSPTFNSLTLTNPLTVPNGGTGAISWTSNGILYGNGSSTLQITAAGLANQVFRVPNAGNPPAFGSIDLSQLATVGASILGVANGGTGLSSLGTANQFLRVNNAGTANIYVSLLGTTNQITVTENATDATLSLPQDIATTSSPTFAALNTTGTAGSGYLSVVNQLSAPSTPGSGFRLYADSSNRFSWKGTNGFVRTFDGTANTADRAYTLPNFSGTFILDQGQQSINGGKTFVPVALVDAANIATDASLGNIFTVTLGGNRNLSAPTNPTNGQKVVWIFKQDATGNRTLTFDAVFNFGVFPTLSLSSGANKKDYMGAIYNSGTTTWDVVAYSVGF